MSADVLPPDLLMLERGWLSSNSLLLLGDARGAVLVDSGYSTHKEQTLALLRAGLGLDASAHGGLRLIVNTHLHSDHCGGNAHLAAAFECPIWVPPGHYQAAVEWDRETLSHAPTGQLCERFTPTQALQPGSVLAQAGRHWQVLAAPGHDPHSLILFEPDSAVLVSADALWEHGFGIVFPAIEGAPAAFDEVEATLDLIAGLPVRVVVPGHGRAFTDVATALAEARARLNFFRLHPTRHARHAAKALLKFHLLEVLQQPVAPLLAWLVGTPIHQQIWSDYFDRQPIADWTLELLDEMQRSGALHLRDGVVYND